jgi:hypothetical protein
MSDLTLLCQLSYGKVKKTSSDMHRVFTSMAFHDFFQPGCRNSFNQNLEAGSAYIIIDFVSWNEKMWGLNGKLELREIRE